MTDDQIKSRGNQLHEQLVHGDVTAPSLMANEILPHVFSELKQRKAARRCDEGVLYDALYDAFFEYTSNVGKFDSKKLGLPAYLGLAAYRNLLNARRDAKTRKKYEESVELPMRAGNNSLEENFETEDQRQLLSQIPGDSLEGKIAGILPDPRDQQACRLMMLRVRATAEFARALGIPEGTDVPAEVKRHKDRIKKALARAGVRLLNAK